ncbi:hypothetical protein DM860_002322 [Cuscuta australis]|uniref:S-adenosyl-L-methionine-dependent methyltransferase n=1 Tax=Cuscuta australis TaxID=267555 RepID=A0A328CYI5_9ASTE|nr:hypothetical protein DM860_002322 [Cuscuta australis]
MLMNRAGRRFEQKIRHLRTAVQSRGEDEGNWLYSSEWWDSNGTDGKTVFRSVSDKGNGEVSVLAYPSSKPDKVYWGRTEKWLQERFAELHPGYNGHHENFKILGYQWRALRFNEETRQSTVKVMSFYRKSDPDSLFLMQQPHCLAIPYVKSMISAGLATISSCNYDLRKAICGAKKMNILCIGHGGGSIPLFLASKIQGAMVHDVEIDPTVISASVQAMGFPSSSSLVTSPPSTNSIQEMLWNGTHERIRLYESDAEHFIADPIRPHYDIVFIDAYDGDDIFPYKLWDPHFPFLKALGDRLHPEHGTVIVNLHSDVDYRDAAASGSGASSHYLPMGPYMKQVCGAYKEALLGNGKNSDGVAYAVSVPWVCNTSLVVARGFGKGESGSCLNRESVLNTLMSKAIEVEKALGLPFLCLGYIKRGFTLVD